MLFLYLLVIGFTCTKSFHLPNGYPICRVTEPHFDDCLTRAANKVSRFLVKGMPDLGIDAIDPLYIPEVLLEANGLKANLTDIIVRGLSGYKIGKYRVDVEKKTVSGKGVIENVTLKGDFALEGQILIMPLKMKGRFNSSIAECVIDVFEKFKVVQRENARFMDQEFTNSSIQVKGHQMDLVETSIERAELRQLAKSIVKQNVDVLFEDFKPAIEKAFTRLLVEKIVNPFQRNVPLDVQLPGFP